MATNSFTASNGLLLFDWFDPGNWGAGLPSGGQDAGISYAPGFGYTIQIGSTLLAADQNPPISLGTLTLNSADATLNLSANLTVGTLDLKAGTLRYGSVSSGPAATLTGTVLAEGGRIDVRYAPRFLDVTWLGDLAIGTDGFSVADYYFEGTAGFGPLPGGGRPVMHLGNGTAALGASLDFRYSARVRLGSGTTLTGTDVIANGLGELMFSVSPLGGTITGTIAPDVTFTATAGYTGITAESLTLLGHVIADGGTLNLAPAFDFLGTRARTPDLTDFNGGTLEAINGGTISVAPQLAGTGTIRIGSGGVFQAQYGIGSGQTIQMLDGAATATMSLQPIEANIAGFHQGDRIIFDNIVAYTPGMPVALSYTQGVLKAVISGWTGEVYVGTGYDPASFSVTTTNSYAAITTSAPAAPAFVPFAAPAPGPATPGVTSFIPQNGRFFFDWNDAQNWTEGTPAAGLNAAVTYAPGYAYQITAGSTLHAPAYNPAVAFQSLVLDSGDAELLINADITFGTLDLKAGRLKTINGTHLGDFVTRSPYISGTIIAEGGVLESFSLFKSVTWVGDMAGANGTGVNVSVIQQGGLTFLPLPGGGRPQVTVGGLSYPSDETITGADFIFNTIGTLSSSSLGIGGPGTIAPDVTITNIGEGIGQINSSRLTNQGHIVAQGGRVDFYHYDGFDPIYPFGLFTNNGTITASGGVVIDIMPTIGTGAWHASNGGVLFLESTMSTGQSITLDDSTASIWLSNAQLNSFIHGFRQGNTIAVVAASASDTASVKYVGGILTVTTGYGDTQIPIGLGYDPTSFHVTVRQDFQSQWNAPRAEITTTSALPCFAAGTRIRTTRGEVAVERLRVGDVVPGPDGVGQTIIWLGHRSLACARHPRPRDVWPVRVRAGAFGEGLPARDLRLSPDHAVFVDGVLIPVRYLVNGATILQERAARVTYWHVEFARHGLLFAEGLPCESYLDTGNRGAFANGGTVVQQHPDFALAVWAASACAPLVLDGAALRRVRAMLAGQAETLGFRCAPGWDGTVMVDGQAVAPRMVAGTLHRYALPKGARSIRLLSPAGVPAEIEPGSTDHRRLGLMLEAAVLRGAGWQRPIDLAALPDGGGFHAPETDGTRNWRWTDGDARLPLGHDGPGVLDLVIGQVHPSWLPPRTLRRAG